jgi:histidinol phosphatase-like PHP family hydrolase
MDLGARYEFHTHTFYSDGVLSVAELLRYGVVRGCAALAVCDHVDFSNVEHVVKSQRKMLREWYGEMRVIQGVELTHTPVRKIGKLARLAKKAGAEIVVMHGETPTEPVEPGTNAAAVACRYVDILAHPGKITAEDAQKALDNGIYLELTARRGHNAGNQHVAGVALDVGAQLLVNSDMHAPDDLIVQERAYEICLESGLDEKRALEVVKKNPIRFMERL